MNRLYAFVAFFALAWMAGASPIGETDISVVDRGDIETRHDAAWLVVSNDR